MKDCIICRAIIELIKAPSEDDGELILGASKDLAAGNCQKHLSSVIHLARTFGTRGRQVWLGSRSMLAVLV
jgi:hypothetical protein